ncbi:MAG: TraB/GumN family protein, partial [Saprospiraceae bacterium]
MKFFFTLLFAFLLSYSPFAQMDAVALVPAKTYAPTADENSLLWEITGKDLTTPSWLYGTIHLIGKDDFFLTDSTKSFIERSEMVTFEINMEDMTDLSAQLGLLMQAFMEGGKTLKDLLSEEDYKLVQDHFQEIGLPLFMFERIKPMFLTVMASGDMSPTAMSSGDMLSYEMEIMELAQKTKKKMGGLESMEFQMSVFDSIPYDAQAQMLVESIKSTEAG